MRRSWLVLVSLIGVALPAPALGRLRVVTTVPDLAAIAREVGGPRLEVSALLLPTQDPHFADPRPHLALQLNRARLLLLVGLELERGWLPTLLRGARNPGIQPGADGYLDVSTVVQLKDVPQQRLDRSMGDIHPGGNPHYLLDPGNAARLARALVRRLSQLDPEGAAAYQDGAERFTRSLETARRRWAEALRPFRGTPVVTYHRSLIYLTDLLGLRLLLQLEPKPGIPPSAAHVLRVIQTVRREKVPLILQEEYYPDRTAQLVAQKSGAQLVVIRGGTDLKAGQRYQARLEEAVQKILAGLRQRRGG